ncbi:MAG: restriction endonuclease subunit S [Gemmataceae bacterium]
MKSIWPTTKLKDVTSFLKDGTHFSPASKDGPFRYVTSKNIRTGRMSLSDCSFISAEDHRRIYGGCPVKFGDVLLTKDGASVGNVCLNELEEEISLLSSVAAIRGKDGVLDNGFLLQFFLSPLGQSAIAAEVAGQAITRVTLTAIGQFQIPLPPLPEQKRIAAILTEWDRAIELTENLIAGKQQRKDALMQRLLMGKVRLPGFRDTHWKACELGDVASNSARRIGTTTPPPVYSVTNSVGMVPMDESVVGASIDRYKAVAKYDFAYNPMRINVGSIAMWEGDGEVLVSPDYVVFRCGPDLDPEFLNHYRTSHQWDQFVTKAGGGSVRVRIYFSDLAELPLKLPSVEEQKAIAAVLNTQDCEIRLLQRKLDALRRQKKGLMQQLLTGRVRVRVESVGN